MKVCTICGKNLELSIFLKDKNASDGYRNQCKPCLRARNAAVWDKRKEGYNSAMRKFRGTWKGVTQTSLSAAKSRAVKSNLPFDITLEHLRGLLEEQGYKCALSGKELKPKGGWDAPSLDKIDPSKGYIIGNVQWLTQRVNSAKSNLTTEDFLSLCKQCLERSETIRKEYTSSEVEAPSSQKPE